ncbi:MAG: uracil phosphoribosyltransferase [Bacteroidia bacterium]|nr:uracil phosphoribosyltransferase [Bacteroidia bacterium]
MTLVVLNQTNSILNSFLAEMRDWKRQKDRLRFRLNTERISEIIAYECSKKLTYELQIIQTPLGQSEIYVLKQVPVIASILRAGLAMHNGFLRMFDAADSAFISAYRYHTRGDEFDIRVEYLSTPDLENQTLLLLDPMIATGRSMIVCYQSLLRFGKPKQIIIGGIIASEEGIETVTRYIPEATIYVAAIDKELTAKAYIVPGLGDAGDLAFGEKI